MVIALKELRVERAFQNPDLAADCALCHAQRGGRAIEAAVASGFFEKTQGDEWGESPHGEVLPTRDALQGADRELWQRHRRKACSAKAVIAKANAYAICRHVVCFNVVLTDGISAMKKAP